MKRWLLKRTKIDTAAMARDLGIRRATAAVLANRELSSRQAARSFLYGGTAALGNPLEMKDFSQAVSLLAEAIRAGKRIAVYGDYDVDGVMSTSILYQTILRCGGNAVFYLPHRQKEGYGLNLRAVEQLAAEGIEVLFTCDNGIAALQEIALAKLCRDPAIAVSSLVFVVNCCDFFLNRCIFVFSLHLLQMIVESCAGQLSD